MKNNEHWIQHLAKTEMIPAGPGPQIMFGEGQVISYRVVGDGTLLLHC